MAVTVPLKNIVDALDEQFEDWRAFLDVETGQVEIVSVEVLSAVEDSSGEEDEGDPEWELAERIITTDRYKSLPTKFDIDEWRMMQEFADSVPRDRLREELLDVIQGSGAFRRFKNALQRHEIEESWYAFRAERFAEIAIEWCKENGIKWK